MRPHTATTDRARRSTAPTLRELGGVASRAQLRQCGYGPAQVRAQIAAHTWQEIGSAIVLHNSAPSVEQLHRVYLLSCGPHSMLTSFTLAEVVGLRGWPRDDVHVLAPAGVAKPHLPGLRLHRVGDWRRARRERGGLRPLHNRSDALVLAASSFARPRPAVGLLASAVQQRLVTVERLRIAVTEATRTRHRAAMLRALVDIGQGAEALSEIDFVRLCARFNLPRPENQRIRLFNGKRRYLDVEWRRADGQIVVVEVDGAHHMEVAQWTQDQLRQNMVTINGSMVLRFTAVVVREEPELVAEQLRQALRL